jgi:hypothetical protein
MPRGEQAIISTGAIAIIAGRPVKVLLGSRLDKYLTGVVTPIEVFSRIPPPLRMKALVKDPSYVNLREVAGYEAFQ